MQRQKVGVKYPSYVSFFVSILIYFFMIGFLLYKVTQVDEAAIKYTDDKNAFMDVVVADIDDSPIPKSPELNHSDTKIDEIKADKKEEKPEVKTTVKQLEEPAVAPESAKEPPKKVEEIPPIKEVSKPVEEKPKEEPKKESLSDLFSATTKDNTKLKESSNKANLVQSSKKSAKETKADTQQAASTQKGVEKGEASGKSSMTGVYDEFRGGVEKQLRILWSRYNALAGNDGTVRITIGADGKLAGYNILQLSYNTEFNQKVRDFEGILQNAIFPKPPDGKPFTHDYKLQDLIQ